MMVARTLLAVQEVCVEVHNPARYGSVGCGEAPGFQ